MDAPIQLNAQWRVARIANPPQWTLERRRIDKGEEYWQPVSFCQTRGALLVAIREKVVHAHHFYKGRTNAEIDPAALALIKAFPFRIDGAPSDV